jgi:hypothetical protein
MKKIKAKSKLKLKSLGNKEYIFISEIDDNSKNCSRKIDTNLIITDENFYENFICVVCLELSDNLNVCVKCEKICCKECIGNLIDNCPICRQKPFFTRPLCRSLTNIFNSLRLKCPYQCGEILFYERYHNHLDTCKNKIKTFKCYNCNEIFQIHTLIDSEIINTHLSKCQKKCNYCNSNVPLIKYIQHESECIDKILLDIISKQNV